jgi:hypothetical protein
MTELLNDLLFVKWVAFIFIMLTAYFFLRSAKFKIYLDESVHINERLDSEAERLNDLLKSYKAELALLNETLGKEQNDNTQLRIVISNLNTENSELAARLSKANVAAMPVRKPCRARNRKPVTHNGQA